MAAGLSSSLPLRPNRCLRNRPPRTATKGQKSSLYIHAAMGQRVIQREEKESRGRNTNSLNTINYFSRRNILSPSVLLSGEGGRSSPIVGPSIYGEPRGAGSLYKYRVIIASPSRSFLSHWFYISLHWLSPWAPVCLIKAFSIVYALVCGLNDE